MSQTSSANTPARLTSLSVTAHRRMSIDLASHHESAVARRVRAITSALASQAHIDVKPAYRDLVLIGLAAFLLRGVLFLVGTRIHGWTLSQFALLRDGPSYLHWAS